MIKIGPIVYKIVVKQQLAPSVIAETNDVQLRSNFQQMSKQKVLYACVKYLLFTIWTRYYF